MDTSAIDLSVKIAHLVDINNQIVIFSTIKISENNHNTYYES